MSSLRRGATLIIDRIGAIAGANRWIIDDADQGGADHRPQAPFQTGVSRGHQVGFAGVTERLMDVDTGQIGVRDQGHATARCSIRAEDPQCGDASLLPHSLDVSLSNTFHATLSTDPRSIGGGITVRARRDHSMHQCPLEAP